MKKRCAGKREAGGGEVNKWETGGRLRCPFKGILSQGDVGSRSGEKATGLVAIRGKGNFLGLFFGEELKKWETTC